MPSVEYQDPLYGTLEFTGASARVIEHPAVQRLKRVHQNGGIFLTNPNMDTSRFEHSLGVAFLCKQLGATKREVIAALLHDVGHTAFSHVADHVFNQEDQAFHENEVERIIDQYNLAEYLDSLGYDIETVFAIEEFPILEQDLPSICADRLDYQLRDVYKYGLIDKHTIDSVLAGITLEAGCPVAADRDTARTIVDVSLLLQRQVFFNNQHEAANLVLSELIKEAINRDILTVNDLFRTDQEVLDTLRNDSEFAEILEAFGQDFSIRREPSKPSFSISRKRRIMNPRVAGTGQRISQLDSTVEYKLSQFRKSVPSEQEYAIEIGGQALKQYLCR